MSIDLKDIKKGDIFWESDSGNNAELRALTDAYEVNSETQQGWKVEVEAISINGKPAGDTPWKEPFSLFECYEPGAYGLSLYSEKAYVTMR